jgi:hypothetical protein
MKGVKEGRVKPMLHCALMVGIEEREVRKTRGGGRRHGWL